MHSTKLCKASSFASTNAYLTLKNIVPVKAQAVYCLWFSCMLSKLTVNSDTLTTRLFLAVTCFQEAYA